MKSTQAYNNARIVEVEQRRTELDLYNDFERETLKRVFQEEYSSNLKTYDLIDHIDHVAAEYDLSDSTTYWALRKGLHSFACQHRALINGAVGERRAYNAIKHAFVEKRVLSNISLEYEGETVEIDFLVFTEAGAFFIEAKNYARDLTVAEDGSFKNPEGKPYNSYNIGERMSASKYIVNAIIKERLRDVPEMPFFTVLLNASRVASVINHFPLVDLCTLGEISAYIESYANVRTLSISEIDALERLFISEAIIAKPMRPESFDSIASGLDDFIQLIESSMRANSEKAEVLENRRTYEVGQRNRAIGYPNAREIIVCAASLIVGAVGGYVFAKRA